jgi:hypothetical protein
MAQYSEGKTNYRHLVTQLSGKNLYVPKRNDELTTLHNVELVHL